MSAALKPPPPPRMSAVEFLAWTERLPDDARYELIGGEPMAMAPETMRHVRAKFQVARRLADAIEGERLPCQVLIDGMGVQADDGHVYIPDAIVHCGAELNPDDRIVEDPLVVVEVASRSTVQIDMQQKLIGYFNRPSLRHYLVVLPEQRRVIHHERLPDGSIATHFRGEEPIPLDPPGIRLSHHFAAG